MVERQNAADPAESASESTAAEAATRPKVASFLVDAEYKEPNLEEDVIGRRDIEDVTHA